MLPTHHLIAFFVTVYVIILIPGPSVRVGIAVTGRHP
jgi:threonine/homoserine/homoserine lactone efflux protein